jgi:hypothetical protein
LVPIFRQTHLFDSLNGDILRGHSQAGFVDEASRIESRFVTRCEFVQWGGVKEKRVIEVDGVLHYFR